MRLSGVEVSGEVTVNSKQNQHNNKILFFGVRRDSNVQHTKGLFMH